ncbi:hypothetical protein [Actinoplanes sp. NPDC020271]|uniref:hypothetical protein n=1 Tax=Actinoplanes sp. NPDC020271 TaxID=3363896 RepID=UPI0037B86BD5
MKADLSAMFAFADRGIGRRDRTDQARNGLSAVNVPRDAFGYVPGVGGRVYDAYAEFVSDCSDVTDFASHALLSLSETVKEVVDLLAETDLAGAADLRADEQLHPGAK